MSEARSRDGTEKALFETDDRRAVEAVLMRYRDRRRSLCLSSQTQSLRGGVRRGDGSNGQGLFFKLNLTLGLI